MAITIEPEDINELFGSSLFANPDAIAKASLAEAPPAQAPPSPSMINNVPVTGLIPKSFLEWGSDPLNISKVANPVPANTPMPSVVTATVKAAAQQAMQAPAAQPPVQPAAGVTPPFSPDVAGSPEAQLYGTPQDMSAAAPQSSGPGLMKNAAQPATLEDALSSGAPAATAAQSQNPAAPLSKADFLAKNPVNIPGAPYVPHGGKLALTGLFAALDNAGAFLDHGTPSVGPGLMRNVQALQEYNQNLPVTQHEAEESSYQNYLKDFGTARQNTLIPLTTIGANGQTITTMVDPKTQQTAIGAGVKAGGTVQAAQIGAQSRMDVKQLELSIQQGQVAKMVPGINPANNQPQYEAFNKAGQSLGFIDHSVVPGLMARTSSTVDYKEDGDGVLHALPKTTVTAPTLPGAGARAPLTPPKPSAAVALPAGAPVAPAKPVAAGAPAPAANAPVPPAAAAPNAGAPKPAAGAGSIVPGFLGKAAKETGVAFNPQDNQYYVTTRADANQNGYQNFTKSTAEQQEKDRQTTNQLADVQTKLDRYQGTFANNLSDQDKTNLAALTSDNEFKVGMFGTELPTGWLKKITSTNAFQALSPEGQARFLAYGNAREAMAGYQKALTGSSRGNEKTLQLQLDTLADPTWTPQAATGAFNQFNENIRTIGRGLPKMPGIPNADAIHNQNQPGAAAGVPSGAKVRDYTQLGK